MPVPELDAIHDGDAIDGLDTSETIARGVAALARSAHEHWVTGHVGAALLAGTWLLRGGTLPEASARALAARLRATVEADPDRYARAESGTPAGVARLEDALDRHVGELWNGAHGTIFAVAALRAFEEQPALATDATVAAIAEVHRGAQDRDPDRYHGLPDHPNREIEGASARATDPDPQSLILDSFRELAEIFPDETIDGKRYFFAGEKLHLVTHAHALIGLVNLGHEDLARRGCVAHRRQIALARQRPFAAKPLAPGTLRPEDPEFWAVTGDPWHDIKFAHAVSELWPLLSERQQETARWQLAPAWAAVT